MSDEEATPNLRHRVQFGALRAVIGALRAAGWRRASDFGARLGALGYSPLGIRRRVVERQIAAAFPGLAHDEVLALARASYENLGRTSIEAALLPTIGREGVLALFDGVDNWPAVEKAIGGGKGMIFVTGHLGNWELAGAYVAARGVPLDVIVRTQANPLFDEYWNETRSALDMVVVRDYEAVRRTPRALREGRGVAFVADQGVRGLASTFVPFFGRPAKTPRGAAVFAVKYDTPTLFVATLRQPSGKYHVAVEPVPVVRTGDREADVDEVVAAYTRILERWVRTAPEQYFWHHRRWRRQPDDTPPELRDPTA